MNKKVLISIILLIIVITIITTIIIYKNRNNVSQEPGEIQNVVDDPNSIIEEIKDETGATASDELYEVQKEYDGREILTIKPDIQFKTVLAGVLKNGKPSTQDIEKLEISKFHQGVWISEISREKFLKILKKCEIENFDIDKNGYLYKKSNSDNKYSQKLEKMINSNELTIIDITGTCYVRDEMTGEIVEYPFKDMDLYQVCEKYKTDGGTIIIITTNNVKETDILNEICD